MQKYLKFFSMLLFLVPSIVSGETDSSNSRIIDVYRLGYEQTSPLDGRISLTTYQMERQTAGINDTVVVKMKDLNALKELALCIPQFQSCNPQNINLYFNGKKIAVKDPKDNGLLGREPDTIEFDLEYDSNKVIDLKKNWASLLGSPTLFSGEFFQRPVQIKVGLDTGTLYSYDGQFQLRRIDMVKFWIFIAILTIISVVVLSFQNVKQKIREALSDIGPTPVSEFKTWSLARCQMAFWFVLVAVSFLSIWVVTGALDTITSSVLALIGMGSGAALGSAMIDVSNNSHLKQLKLDDLILISVTK